VCVRAHASRFSLHHSQSAQPFAPTAFSATVAFPPVADGTLLAARLSAQRRSGLVGAAPPLLVLVDASPPRHPARLWGCAGRAQLGEGNVSYQRGLDGLRACWAAGGFSDAHSGLAGLEWVLYRRINGVGWVKTQQGALDIGEPRAQSALAAGALSLYPAELSVGWGTADELRHPSENSVYRLAVRARNLAGLHSEEWPELSPGSAAPDPPGAEVWIDSTRPVCFDSLTAVCDPSGIADPTTASPTTSSGSAAQCPDLALSTPVLGAAGNGFLGAPDAMRVRWSGFSDTFSGVSDCVVEVKRVVPPGRLPLGARCTCSASLPPPHTNRT
jgi:hypothetical protein